MIKIYTIYELPHLIYLPLLINKQLWRSPIKTLFHEIDNFIDYFGAIRILNIFLN